jgi:nicotinamide-nucleotide amidase
MDNEVLPRLKVHFNAPTIYHRVVRTIGIGESFLAEKIEDWEDNLPQEIKLAYLPGNGQVKLRLTGIGDELSYLKQLVQAEVEKLEKYIPEYIYSTKNQEMPEVVGELLIEQKKTIAVAESCTGGYLAHLISEIPGCSRYFMGSITSYDNSIKIGELGVSPQTLAQFGAVSEQTATEMAEGIRQKMNVDFALATTGVAGPTGGSEEKPVGTVWIACAGPKGTVTQKLQLTTQRGTNIRWASYLTLNLLRKELIKNQ